MFRIAYLVANKVNWQRTENLAVTRTKKLDAGHAGLDQIDFKILNMVRADGRISLTAMSRKLGLSKSAVKYRLDRLIELRVVRSFFALVDAGVYGIKLSVVFDLTVEPKIIQDVAVRLSALNEVIRVYELTNSPELHVHALFTDNEQLEQFIRNKLYTIGGIRAIKTGMIMKRYKTELTLTI